MRLTHPLILVSVVAAFSLLTGCTDNLFSADNAAEQQVASSDGKLRHDKFLGRARKTVGLGSNGPIQTLGIIFKVEDHVIEKQRVMERYKVMERNKVLERNRVLERYKVMERYEYDGVFSGWAIVVEDTTGLNDFDDFVLEMGLDPDIAWFEPDFSLSMPVSVATDAGQGQVVPWSVAQVGADESEYESGSGHGAVSIDLYVLDTGVSNDDINVVESVDFRGLDQPDPEDHDGHGTHVAGIAAAVDDADGLVGVAPGARVHNYKVLNDDGKTDVSVVIAAVEHITQQRLADPSKPMVVNMSIGENLGTTQYSALDEAIEASIAAGVVYVVSAGNDGVDASLVTPAHVSSAITVGAYDLAGYFAPYSNFGPMVDILAPGSDIISLKSGVSGSGNAEMSGTSMAAAHVSGAAALVLAESPSATPAEVLDRLISASKSDVMGGAAGTTANRVWVGTKSILFVVPDANAPSSQDSWRRELFEKWNWGVNYITASASQAEYDAALTASDVVFISEETNSGDVSWKLSDKTIGVVSGEAQLKDELGVSSDVDWDWSRNLTVNGDHYITRQLTGTVQVFDTEQSVQYYTGSVASGAQALASWPGGATMMALAAGQATYNQGAAAGRRVQLPWGGNDLDITRLTEDGMLLLRRAIEWASGDGVDLGSVPTAPVTGSLERRIATGDDDVEERSSGSMYMDSSDLELVEDGSRDQLIGMRFTGLEIPARATITNAYVQFTVDEKDSGTSSLTIRAQNSGDATAFSSSDFNLSSRLTTSASAFWAPGAWSSVGAAGSEQRTPDISAVVQEVVDRGDWGSGNDLVIVIDGSGERTAESYNGSSSKAPMLHVEWRQ